MSPTRTTRILASIGEPSRDLSSETSRRAGIEFVCIFWTRQEGFTFRVQFSEEIGTSSDTLRDESFTVTAGNITGAHRVPRRQHY